MMKQQRMLDLLKSAVLAVVMSSTLAGCLSLDEQTSSGNASSNVNTAVTDVLIAGSVGDGPVTGATITVYSSAGDVLGAMVSDSTASFRSTFKTKGNQYPLRLVVSGGVDLVTGMAPDFEMVSVMTGPSVKQVNINPFSTLIVKIAEGLTGGLDSNNVESARGVVIDQLGFGLDPNIIDNPITAMITDDNVAHLVKASEALGEMVRRTRDRIAATGKSVNGDAVLTALAADLADGVVDGLGAGGANPLVASVATVVSGQVIVEAMSNNLRVGGVIATPVIDQAIAITRPRITAAQQTGSVNVSAQMIEQARIAVAAAQVLDTGSAVMDVATGIAGLRSGMSPVEAEALLPVGSSLALENAVQLVATASSTDMAAINHVVSTGGVSVPPAVNAPPVISGMPAGSVTADSSYVFQPSAADVDGDTLSFTISNKPSWANFSTGNGRLSGIPTAGNIGSYSGIVISVTDGTDTASLGAFSITVDPAPVVNTAPVIGGTPAGTVTAGNSYQFQPIASDPDGDTLTFSIVNKPAWATFNTNTGGLSGTPAAGDVGSYSGISISVTDGTDGASLAAFSITVNPAPVQTGSLGLTWVAPVARADGTPLSLSDIDGYRIYYGTVAGTYPNSVDITDGSATSATVAGLPVGTYHVVMSTYDTNGMEGSRSAQVTKTVP